MDNKFISILILVILGISLVLSKIPQLNPKDMWSRDIPVKGMLRLFFIALIVFILIMIITVFLINYSI